MTDYYNTEARTRKLDRFRRAKALAAEKLRIEEEERKLREEEELEMALPRSAPIIARASSTLSHNNMNSHAVSSTQSSASNTLPTPITPSTGSASTAVPVIKEEAQSRNRDDNNSSNSNISDTASKNPAKRAHDDNEDDAVPKKEAKVPRIDAPLAPHRRTDSDNAHTTNRRDDRSGDSNGHNNDSRHRPSHDSLQDSSSHRRHGSPARFKEEEGFERKYDSYKSGPSNGESRRRELEGSTQYPVPVDLGHKGDSRFFIVKSFNAENVKRCMKDGIWTTQLQNSQIFADAFAKCRNVILFFSVNKSRAFQGYARMITPPSSSVPRPSFIKDIHFDASDPFRVSWLSKTAVHFFRIGHIKNAYNDFAPVLVGKDGQEIEGEAGAELVREMEKFAEAWQSGGPFPAAPRRDGDRDRDRENRRGSGGSGFYGRERR
ncbi:YT521-B-like domain-containing protein [Dichotomopilus funicola]|uniref:YT521-B-like domain-containing protein n=1 Tax=Dichotomopilus funicola TaxID=1934379 RepID=A0AAN6ZQ35_9PEZI|nr:YT521-B-like domain-containing protein [Dichotomopilus funicola]